jgi:tetratricopeptide (TPR) repeat protein
MDDRSQLGQTQFVGRARQLELLREAFGAARAGHGRVVMLAGEPGIGKTCLCEQIAEHARRHDATVRWGHCYEGEGAPAFWPWIQILRACATELRRDVLVQLLGAAAAPLAPFLPALATLPPPAPSRPVAESPESRFQLFDAVLRLLQHIADQAPLVLVFDDLQGADASSLLLLQFIARTLQESRLLVVGTYRDLPLPPDHPLAETLGELARIAGREQVTLGGLSSPEVEEYVRRATGLVPSAALVDALHRYTEGNPFFLSEFIAALRAERRLDAGALADVSALTIPASVRAVIERRLAPLSQGCREVLQRAAVLGREFRGGIVEVLHPAAFAGIQEATAARILQSEPRARGYYRFAHALIRETLYDDLSGALRRDLHHRVGEAMEQRPEAPELVAELAHHFLAAGDTHKAVTYAQQAGDRALQLLAYEEAARLYQLGLDALRHTGADGDTDLRRCTLLVALGEAQRAADDVEHCKQTMLEAAGLARTLGARELLARAALGYGTKSAWGEEGTCDEALIRLLDDALNAWGHEDSGVHARLQARSAMALYFSPTGDRRIRLARQALEMARRVGEPNALAHALNALHITTWAPDNLEERLALATELVHCAEQSGERDLTFQGHIWTLLAYTERADRAHLENEIAVCRQLADQLREPFCAWMVSVYSCTCRLMEGDFAAAERLANEGLAIGERVIAGAAQVFGVQMMMLHRTRGQLDALEPMAPMFAALAAQYPAVPAFLTSAAALHANLEHPAEAHAAFECLAKDDFASLPFNQTWLMSVTDLTEACVFLRDTRRAATLYNLLNPFRTHAVVGGGGLAYAGPVTHYLGMLAAVLSRWEDAEQCFEAALAINLQMRARPWLAKTQYEYAALLRARGRLEDHGRAARLATDALATARELQMPSVANKAAALLQSVQAGADRRRESTPPPASNAQQPEPGDEQPEPTVFRREGDYWIVAGDGVVLRLKDSKGLQYIAYLLRHPNREFHVLDLVARVTGLEGDDIGDDSVSAAVRAPATGVIRDQVLDAQARVEYTRRLADLREELEEAERHHDAGRSERLRGEVHAIAEQLATAVGLGGRSRVATDNTERARSAVTKRIKEALAKVDREHPRLGGYLRDTIRTGTFCSYALDKQRAVQWVL